MIDDSLYAKERVIFTHRGN